jgi:hypothetical protein
MIGPSVAADNNKASKPARLSARGRRLARSHNGLVTINGGKLWLAVCVEENHHEDLGLMTL